MNVKKSKLRNEIFDFISSNPSSEVKDIAAHAGVTKQALYYHIKILTEQKKIAVTDSTIVNGIEKKFYSIASSGKEDQKEGTFDDLKADIVEDSSNLINKNEPSTIDDTDKDNLITDTEKSVEDRDTGDLSADLNTNATIIENEISISSNQITDQKSQSDDSDIDNKNSRIVTDSSKTTPKKSFFTNPFKKSLENVKNNDKTDDSRGRLQTIFSNIKSLGLFNLDSYDTMGSATALVTSTNRIITFNNRKDSKFNVDLHTNSDDASKNAKRNDRLVVIDENFIDNHERIITPLKKEKDRQAFLKRFIQMNYFTFNQPMR